MHEVVAVPTTTLSRGRDAGEADGEGTGEGGELFAAPAPAPVRRAAQPFVLHHLPALDGLRGLAVAGVLAFHGDHLVGGYLGVDLFFVLSGFLITSLLLREGSATGRIARWPFWARRARRLLPALFGLLVGVAVYARVWASPFELGTIRSDALGTVAYVANWSAIWSGHGYWDLFTTPSPLQHTWSLAIEEQFYLVWPLVIGGLAWLLARRRPAGTPASRAELAPAVLVLAVVAGAASALWMLLQYDPADPSRAYFGTDTRAASILAGAGLAAWLAWRGTATSATARRAIGAAGLAGALWLAFAWTTIDGQASTVYRGGFALSAAAVVAILLAITHPVRGPISTVLSIAPLRGLGLISYGLYLWHWPVFVVLQLQHARLGLDGMALFAVQVAVSLAFALVSFVVLERPIRVRGLAAWGPRGSVLLPIAAVCAVLAVLVTTAGGDARAEFAYGGASDPLAAASGAATRGTLPVVADDPVVTTAPPTAPVAPSTTTAAPAPAPLAGPLPRPEGRLPRVLVVGDSVAYYLGHEGLEAMPELGLQVGNQAMFKCTLSREHGVWKRRNGIPDAENPDCRRWPKIWGDAIDAFKPDAVVLLFGGPPQGEVDLGDGWYEPCSTPYHDEYRREVDAAVDVLAARGATVFLTPSAHPRFPFLPDDIDQRTDCINAVYREVAAARPDRARILALDDWTCPPPGKQCTEEVDGVNVREDGIHYRGAGAQVASRWVATQLFAG